MMQPPELDPSWPPPSPAQPARAKRRASAWFWVGVVPAAAAGVFVLAIIVLNMFGIEIHDPTEGVEAATVVNGLGRTARVGLCANRSCSSAVGSQVLRPGGSILQNVGPDMAQPMVVFALNGRRVGCWELPRRVRPGNYRVVMRRTHRC